MNGGNQVEITRLGLLLDLREYYTFRLTQHAKDFLLTVCKPGHELHFSETKQKLTIIDELIIEAEGTKE